MAWMINRIQLYFYNGCENRWKLFQEGEKLNKDQSPFFRVQIGELLKTVRAALEKHCFTLAASSGRDFEIKFRPTSSGEAFSDKLRDFKNFLLDALPHEGICDRNLTRALQNAPTDQGQEMTWKIPARSARNLISILPIRFDWDVVGWLHPMSTSSTRFHLEFWHKDFAYKLCEIAKASNFPPTAKQPLLNYSYHLRMWGDDKEGAARLDPDPRLDIPYFEFAKTPWTSGSTENKRTMNAEESQLYHFYAAAMDSARKSSAIAPMERSASYYFVLPVPACGYFHFLEFEMIPTDLGDDDTNFRKQTQALLEGKDKLVVKDSLRELLVQIRLSAFQHRVTEWIADKGTEILSSPTLEACDNRAVECFCDLAPLINEMRVIETKQSVWCDLNDDDKNFVRKVTKPWSKRNRGANGKEVGVQRNKNGEVTRVSVDKPGDLLRDNYCRVFIDRGRRTQICIWLFHTKDLSPAMAAVFKGTNHRRLEEQFAAVKERVRRVWLAGERPNPARPRRRTKS